LRGVAKAVESGVLEGADRPALISVLHDAVKVLLSVAERA
jgi:hypothetical protein